MREVIVSLSCVASPSDVNSRTFLLYYSDIPDILHHAHYQQRRASCSDTFALYPPPFLLAHFSGGQEFVIKHFHCRACRHRLREHHIAVKVWRGGRGRGGRVTLNFRWPRAAQLPADTCHVTTSSDIGITVSPKYRSWLCLYQQVLSVGLGIAQMKFETGKQEDGLLDTLYISYFIWRVLFVSASVHNFELKFFKMDLKIKMEPNNYVIKIHFSEIVWMYWFPLFSMWISEIFKFSY